MNRAKKSKISYKCKIIKIVFFISFHIIISNKLPLGEVLRTF